MNEVFVNHTNVNLPSYDLGGVIELEIAKFFIRGLIMNTKFEVEEDFKNYNYYALQVVYTIDTEIGEGNYRIYGFTTNDEFSCWNEEDEESLMGIGMSADQELSKIIGIFARVSWQDDSAAVDHDALYSAGVNINGRLWGRENDEIGAGYAYLDGACKGDIDNTSVFETYAKFQITRFSDVTVDLQYIAENMQQVEDIDGFIYGVRLNTYF
jgi:porin